MKTFKQYLAEANSKMRYFGSMTKEDIGKVFKIYDNFHSKKIILEPNPRQYVHNLKDVSDKSDTEFNQLDNGTKIKILDASHNWGTKVLYIVLSDGENGRQYHYNGNDLVRKAYKDHKFVIEISYEDLKKTRDQPYLLAEDDMSADTGSLVGLSFYGSFKSANKEDESVVTFDEDTKNKIFYGSITMSALKLNSFEGSPKEVVGWIQAWGNNISSFEGAPKKITYETKTTWSFGLSVGDNPISSLVGIPEYVGGGVSFNECTKLTSISKIHTHLKYTTKLEFKGCPIRSGVLGLLKIKGLEKVTFVDENDNLGNQFDLSKVETIVNKYLPEGDLLACQEELIDAGLEDFAKL